MNNKDPAPATDITEIIGIVDSEATTSSDEVKKICPHCGKNIEHLKKN